MLLYRFIPSGISPAFMVCYTWWYSSADNENHKSSFSENLNDTKVETHLHSKINGQRKVAQECLCYFINNNGNQSKKAISLKQKAMSEAESLKHLIFGSHSDVK